MLISPRKKKQEEFQLGLPPGGWAKVTESGWVRSKAFLVWFKELIASSKATKESSNSLLFDGHAAYTKNIEFIDVAQDNGVILLCFRPNCSRRRSSNVDDVKAAKKKRDIKEPNKVERAKRKLSLGGEKNIKKQKSKNVLKGKSLPQKKMSRSKRESASSDTDDTAFPIQSYFAAKEQPFSFIPGPGPSCGGYEPPGTTSGLFYIVLF
ncbi:hypothetical protein Trydic_g20716 [Trypoxylus dichotomus]